MFVLEHGLLCMFDSFSSFPTIGWAFLSIIGNWVRYFLIALGFLLKFTKQNWNIFRYATVMCYLYLVNFSIKSLVAHLLIFGIFACMFVEYRNRNLCTWNSGNWKKEVVKKRVKQCFINPYLVYLPIYCHASLDLL